MKAAEGRPSTPKAERRPLYWRVANDIIEKIQAGVWRPGDKLPSERALCESYGVSQITVRRALRELAHMERVRSRHGLGWFVSDLVDRPDTPRTDKAAESPREATLVLPRLDWLTAPLVEHLVAELGARGVLLRLAFTNCDAEHEALAVQRWHTLAETRNPGTSALLLAVGGEEQKLAARYTQLVENTDLPVLLLLRDVADIQMPAALLGERACMEILTRHILSLGHRRVAYAGDDPATVEGWQHYWGFATMLWGDGLELSLDWVFSSSLLPQEPVADAAPNASSDAERFRQAFQARIRPTALVCASDTRAAEAMAVLQDLGLHCPDDVAIVGLGDREFAPLLPTPLTTFRFDIPGLSRAIATMTLDLLDGRPVENAVVSGEMVVRESCGAGLARGY